VDADEIVDWPELFKAQQQGERAAQQRFITAVYLELHRIALRLMQAESPSHTLQPTALIAELFVKFQNFKNWSEPTDKNQFLGQACKAMREILIDHARKKKAVKHGGQMDRSPLDLIVDRSLMKSPDLDLMLDVNAALGLLGANYPRQEQVATLQIYFGMEPAEIAAELDVSESTVRNDLKFVKAWLRRHLEEPAKE
jgi:RNA polymerase sigma factor (TIGR02999 family)